MEIKGKGLSYKWWLLGFLFVTYFLEQSARQVYGAVLPQIKQDFASFGIGDAQLGLVGSVFTLVFGISLVGSGFAADFLGRKRVLVVGTLLFSMGVVGCGMSTGVGLLVLCYGVVNALGQCCIAPPAYSLISQYHDNRTRSIAMGVFQSAVYVGVILSSVSAGALAQLGPGRWRWAFWSLGCLGLLWAVAMKCLMKDTPQVVERHEEKPTVREGLAALLKKPTAILIAVAFGMFIYVSCGVRLWTVAFLHRCYPETSLAQSAFHAVFWFYLGAMAGLFATARGVDRYGKGRPAARLDVSIVGLLLGIVPMVGVSQAPTLVSCCVWLFALGLAVGVYEAAHYPAMFDCIAPRYRSVATGLTGCFAFVVGSFAPGVMGWMNEALSIRTGMASLAVFFLLGALVLLPARIWYFKKDYVGK